MICIERSLEEKRDVVMSWVQFRARINVFHTYKPMNICNLLLATIFKEVCMSIVVYGTYKVMFVWIYSFECPSVHS